MFSFVQVLNISSRSREPGRHDDRKPADNKTVDERAVVDADAKEKAVVDDDAVGDILAELRRQQEEQKKLLHEQRKIVSELRRHENVAHHQHDDNKYRVRVRVCVRACVCKKQAWS